MKIVSVFMISVALLFSNCSKILTANFESDVIGNDPNKSLPGSPVGDEIIFADEVAHRLEIVATPTDVSEKSMQMSDFGLLGNPPLGTSEWVSFKSKSSNFSNPVTYTWTATQNFSNNASKLMVDVSDGGGHLATRIYFEGDGDVFLLDDIVAETGVTIGSINDGESYTVVLSVHLSDNEYHVSILKPSGDIVSNDHPLISNVLDNPARPQLSFQYDGGPSNSTIIFDGIYISRKN